MRGKVEGLTGVERESKRACCQRRWVIAEVSREFDQTESAVARCVEKA